MKKKSVAVAKSHGGTCSSCGQVATTCVTGSLHAACRGYVTDYDFNDPLLNEIGKTEPMRADGTIATVHVSGIWLSSEDLFARRGKNIDGWIARAKQQVRMTSVFEDVPAQPTDDPSKGINPQRRYVRTDVTNGLGTPLVRRDGAWVPIFAGV